MDRHVAREFTSVGVDFLMAVLLDACVGSSSAYLEPSSLFPKLKTPEDGGRWSHNTTSSTSSFHDVMPKRSINNNTVLILCLSVPILVILFVILILQLFPCIRCSCRSCCGCVASNAEAASTGRAAATPVAVGEHAARGPRQVPGGDCRTYLVYFNSAVVRSGDWSRRHWQQEVERPPDYATAMAESGYGSRRVGSPGNRPKTPPPQYQEESERY